MFDNNKYIIYLYGNINQLPSISNIVYIYIMYEKLIIHWSLIHIYECVLYYTPIHTLYVLHTIYINIINIENINYNTNILSTSLSK